MENGLVPAAPVPVAGNNPYRAPRADVRAIARASDDSDVLAGRGARLAAAIIDYLCVIAAALPGLVGYVVADAKGAHGPATGLASMVFIMGLGLLGLTQATYIVRDGQTIGKKWMKIRIVDHRDGSVPSWPRVLGLRYVGNLALRQIPLYFFIDVVPILGKDQRCVHDYIAGTKVVEVHGAS